MNIFKALSQGKGAVNEENTSSFLAYLLNPNEDHGLGNVFLCEFLTSLEQAQAKKDNLSEILKNIIDKNQLKYENKDIKVRLETKYNVAREDKNTCAIDFELVFENSENGSEEFKFCIENKTKVNSVTPNQLQEEYEAVINARKENENNSKIVMIYLTPDSDKCLEEYQKLTTQSYDSSAWITWYSTDENNTSCRTIKNMIENLMEKERSCKIAPIPEYLLHTLKAFLFFFVKPVSSRRNEVVTGEFREIKYGEDYTIRKYKNGRIEVVDNEGNLFGNTKEALRNICDKEKWEYRTDYTTHQLGDWVIKQLKGK
ncbi:MAG: PD-(D/E)XK nuclease family protein [Alphaproteobacteria bacterium]|nr:PD-(D/E)XK nuclease family protein [Alphaproteobacteria bacterium]